MSWALSMKLLIIKFCRPPSMTGPGWCRSWLGAVRQQAITRNETMLTQIDVVILHHKVTTQWVNSLWPSDIIRRQGTESTLAQVMACCLTASSHYLNHSWLIISKVLWHSSEGIIMRRSKIPISKTRLKITFLEYHSDLPGANELTLMAIATIILLWK